MEGAIPFQDTLDYIIDFGLKVYSALGSACHPVVALTEVADNMSA